MTHLLDVNALVALIWTTHVHHHQAKSWSKGKKTALCPISELGFIRTSPLFGASMDDARRALSDFLRDEKPEFVAADIDALHGAVPRTPADSTDIYLANLADAHGMRLATFDSGIRHPAVDLIG